MRATLHRSQRKGSRTPPRKVASRSSQSAIRRWAARQNLAYRFFDRSSGSAFPVRFAAVTRLRPAQLSRQVARQLPDPSTTLQVEPSSTSDSRLRGARSNSNHSDTLLLRECGGVERALVERPPRILDSLSLAHSMGPHSSPGFSGSSSTLGQRGSSGTSCGARQVRARP